MSDVNHGGAAFPVPLGEGQRYKAGVTGVGMTLRDYFAAKAVQSQLTAFWAMETHHGWSHEEIAQEAYRMADAMITERNKGQ